MFDRLIDILLNFIELFYFTFTIEQYEAGVVLRFGKFHRMVKPGIHFRIPFGIERTMSATTVYDTMSFTEKLITLCDGTIISCGISVGFTVFDVKSFLLEVDGAEAALIDSVMMLAPGIFGRVAWPEMADPDSREQLEKKLLSVVRRRCKRFGIDVEVLAINNLAKCRALYLQHNNAR